MPSPIVLVSTEIVGDSTSVAPPPASITVEPLPVVAVTVPAPTLVDGRPQ